MAGTINLFERLLDRGGRLIACGRPADARQTLEQLLTLPDLDIDSRVAAHWQLASIHLDAQRFRKARRQLAAVIALQPGNANALYRYALAVDLDPDADPRHAWRALTRALRVCPHEPAYWSAFGQIALRLGRSQTALKAFRQATKLAPTAVQVLDEIADGLVALGREEEAGALLAAARFRLPRDAGVERLWNRFRFDCLRRQQQAARRGVPAGRAIFPFIRVMEPGGARAGTGAGVIRSDRFSKAAPHLHRLDVFRSGPRHAP